MIIEFSFSNKRYSADLQKPNDISIALQEGQHNPNCYWAEPVKFETISSGSFIGSVKQGGSVNYQKVTLTPHGNGTHTECYGHITADDVTVNQSLNVFHFVAELITIKPEQNDDSDCIISDQLIASAIKFQNTSALVVRTLPNDQSKKTRQYSGSNPPYFTHQAIKAIVSKGVQHLLVDLPSVDKEVDGGKLLAHKAFWSLQDKVRKYCTITELIFVDDSIPDGLYLLNLQIPSFEMDAAPSKPVLYKLREVL